MLNERRTAAKKKKKQANEVSIWTWKKRRSAVENG
jgi:hypothetical protein